jgi:hypothetical protein
MRTVQFGDVEVTRVVVGGNPFSGFSHQGPERDREMLDYYTVANIKAALAKAEAAGINTFFGRTDRHVRRLLREYWAEGGTIQWFGQTASELGDQLRAIRDAARDGAKGVYIHGGQTDYWYAHGEFDMFHAALKTMRECGVVAGFAGHLLAAHEWMRDNLELDFQMVCYYDPTDRSDSPHHVSTIDEKWNDEERARKVEFIHTLPWSAAHYKVFAGGNKPIDDGFHFLAGSMRENDLVCVGHYLKDNPEMLAENVRTFEQVVEGS